MSYLGVGMYESRTETRTAHNATQLRLFPFKKPSERAIGLCRVKRPNGCAHDVVQRDLVAELRASASTLDILRELVSVKRIGLIENLLRQVGGSVPGGIFFACLVELPVDDLVVGEQGHGSQDCVFLAWLAGLGDLEFAGEQVHGSFPVQVSTAPEVFSGRVIENIGRCESEDGMFHAIALGRDRDDLAGVAVLVRDQRHCTKYRYAN